jgi:hypothetical protein
MSDHLASSVISAVEQSFAGVPSEGVRLREAWELCNYGTPQELELARFADTEHDWRELDPALIEQAYGALSFCDASGLRFCLPAFMRYAVTCRNTSASAADHCILSLNPELPSILELASVLTPSQVDAVCRFLRFVALNPEEYLCHEAASLYLRSYWSVAEG